MSLINRIQAFGKIARQALLDEISRREKAAGKAGKVKWAGYDSQGNGIIKKDGKEIKVKILGGKSISSGQSLYLDSQNTVQTRDRSRSEARQRPKKRSVPKKSRKSVRPLILADEENLLLYTPSLDTVWVTYNSTTGFRNVYSSRHGYIGGYNVIDQIESTLPDWVDRDDEIKQSFLSLFQTYFEEDFFAWDPGSVFSYTIDPTSYLDIQYVFTGDEGDELFYYVVDGYLYIVEFPCFRITSKCNIDAVGVDPAVGSIGKNMRSTTYELAILSAVTVFSVNLSNQATAFNIDYYLKQELDVSGFTSVDFVFPDLLIPKFQGVQKNNVTHVSVDTVIKGLLPASHLFKQCSNLWFDETAENDGVEDMPPLGAHTISLDLPVSGGYSLYTFVFPDMYYGTSITDVYGIYVRTLHDSKFFNAFNVSGLNQIPDIPALIGAWYRTTPINISLDSEDTKCIIGALLDPNLGSKCELIRSSSETWESDVITYLEEGENPTFAESVVSRAVIYEGATSGLSAADAALVLSEPQYNTLIDPDVLSSVIFDQPFDNTISPVYFDYNDTDLHPTAGGSNLLELFGLTPQAVLFVGYNLTLLTEREIAIEDSEG